MTYMLNVVNRQSTPQSEIWKIQFPSILIGFINKALRKTVEHIKIKNTINARAIKTESPTTESYKLRAWLRTICCF